MERGKARPPGASSATTETGIVASQVTATVGGTNTTLVYENSNYIQVPPQS